MDKSDVKDGYGIPNLGTQSPSVWWLINSGRDGGYFGVCSVVDVRAIRLPLPGAMVIIYSRLRRECPDDISANLYKQITAYETSSDCKQRRKRKSWRGRSLYTRKPINIGRLSQSLISRQILDAHIVVCLLRWIVLSNWQYILKLSPASAIR